MLLEGLIPILLVVGVIAFAVVGNIIVSRLTRNHIKGETPHPIQIKSRFFGVQEQKLYLCLKRIVQNTEGVVLFAKVRWEDIWNAKKGDERLRYRGFLKSRRVDFLIVKEEENIPYLIIEILEGREDKERTKNLKEFCTDTRLHLLLVIPREVYSEEEVRTAIRHCLESDEMVFEMGGKRT